MPIIVIGIIMFFFGFFLAALLGANGDNDDEIYEMFRQGRNSFGGSSLENDR